MKLLVLILKPPLCLTTTLLQPSISPLPLIGLASPQPLHLLLDQHLVIFNPCQSPTKRSLHLRCCCFLVIPLLL
jgi:hypothetical protein